MTKSLVVMRPTLAHLLICVSMLCCAQGCATQQQFAFDGMKLNVPMVGKETATLLVLDQRSAVVNHTEPETFVGYYQETADAKQLVVTASGEPFAEDVSGIVADALKRSGFAASVINAPAGTSEQQAFQTLRAKPAEHLLLLQIFEWHSKTFKNTEVGYQLSLSVFNSAGALKGEGRVKGTDQLPESHSDAVGMVNQAVQRALEHKLRQLFSEPKVTEAFQRQN